MPKFNCNNCHNARTKNNRVVCSRGKWLDRTFSFRCVKDARIPLLKMLPKTCPDYSPPDKPYVEQPLVFVKDERNRRKIGKIINAVRDGRKHWSYDEPTPIKDAYWEVWE